MHWTTGFGLPREALKFFYPFVLDYYVTRLNCRPQTLKINTLLRFRERAGGAPPTDLYTTSGYDAYA